MEKGDLCTRLLQWSDMIFAWNPPFQVLEREERFLF
jgi:hypothetical protein